MDDELSPHQAERVRRLLAEARHTEPTPDDVAARLDRVIAGLADDPDSRPAAVPAPAPVVRLDERRRRAGRLLLAAAVVVVGGVAVGQLVGGSSMEAGSGGESSEPAAGTAEDQGLSAPDRDGAAGGDRSTLDQGESGAEMPGAVSETRRSISRQPPAAVRSERFASDARALAPGNDEGRSATSASPGAPSTDTASCPPGPWGGGRYVRVVLDRESGWLVYRPPRGATQVVDLFLCATDTDAPERSATLPLD